MDGEFSWKTYEQKDDLGVQYPYFRKHPKVIAGDLQRLGIF